MVTLAIKRLVNYVDIISLRSYILCQPDKHDIYITLKAKSDSGHIIIYIWNNDILREDFAPKMISAISRGVVPSFAATKCGFGYNIDYYNCEMTIKKQVFVKPERERKRTSIKEIVWV